MIKLIAAITMLIDHIGALLFPRYYVLRMVGRISMPLYGFCIGRGFYYSKKKGTIGRYLKNLAIFSILSQIPRTFVCFYMGNFTLNIIFNWFLSVLLLKFITQIKYPIDKKGYIYLGVAVVIILASLFLPVEYETYGLLMPLTFYFFVFKMQSPILCLAANILLYFVYFLQNIFREFIFQKGIKIYSLTSDIQFYSIVAIFLVLFLNSSNEKDILPRRFFYWFYPVHLVVLGLVRWYLEVGLGFTF